MAAKMHKRHNELMAIAPMADKKTISEQSEPMPKKVSDVFGMLKRTGQKTCSVAAMDDAIAEYICEKHR